jgi:hypothetical protein
MRQVTIKCDNCFEVIRDAPVHVRVQDYRGEWSIELCQCCYSKSLASLRYVAERFLR